MEKIKFQLEFTFNTSPKLLYSRFSTPSGLAEWFADDVRLKSKDFTFFWDGSEQTAKLLMKKSNEYIRFKWEDDDEDDIESYFEFKITTDELTNDVALIITDFAEEDEIEDSKDLWDQQINNLKRAIGL
ncbi:MAG: SRPBCC domain-containing protein [Bacteroidales bacterium]|nr:SRPBCC domain-containing protein [Bacteroidales bacterium]MBN2757527.1 SRPBCC domain-containing protein [Bacteroidales bacterium]